MSDQSVSNRSIAGAAVVLPTPRVETRARADRALLVQLGFLMAALSIVYFASFLLDLDPAAPAAPLVAQALVCMGAGVSLGFAMTGVAKDPATPHDRLPDLGLLLALTLCVVLSSFPVQFQELQGLPPPRATLTCLVVIACAAFVPSAPRKTAMFVAVASATQPLALALLSFRPVALMALLASAATAGVAALAAAVGGRLMAGARVTAKSGRMMGPYRLTRRLEHTSNTETWRAEHHLLARPAALKWIRPRAVDLRASPRLLRRFEREAQAVASLSSPHTVTLFEFGVAPGGEVYYVTELPEGRTLAATIEVQGAFSTPEVTRIVLELCDSLGEAHQNGISHGRLSANNVLLCRVGGRRDHVKVLEFGLSQISPGWGLSDREGGSLDSAARIASGIAADVSSLGHLIELMATARYNPSESERDEMDPHLRAVARRCIRGELSDARDVESALLGVPPPPEREVVLSRGPAQLALEGVATDQGSAVRSRLLPDVLRDLLTAGGERGSKASLSASQLDSARKRLGYLALFVLAGNLLLGSTWGLRGPAWDAQATTLAAVWTMGLLLDGLMLLATRSPRFEPNHLLTFGRSYAGLRTIIHAAMAVLAYMGRGVAAPGLTFVVFSVVAYPLVIPTPPRRVLPIAAIAACAIPVLLGLLGDPVPSFGVLVECAWIGALAVGSAYCVTAAHRVTVTERPREFGSYELLEVIGRGAMGEVWRARHQLLTRPAALKTIRPDRAPSDPNLLNRLWREARITARLTSPHTVRLFDYGVADDGTCYYAMELLHGIDLQELVERTGPLDADRSIEIALDVCDSLTEAHALGLVHRDLKPSNLFQCKVGLRDDLIKVLDFGLARLNRALGDQSADDSSTIVGTPAYMAPETLLGQAIDARADIYALGAVLYFLLTGQHAFEKGNAVATVLARLHEPPPSIRDVAPEVPAELDAIVTRCLQRDPTQRFQSIEDVESALLTVPRSDGQYARPEYSERMLLH